MTLTVAIRNLVVNLDAISALAKDALMPIALKRRPSDAPPFVRVRGRFPAPPELAIFAAPKPRLALARASWAAAHDPIATEGIKGAIADYAVARLSVVAPATFEVARRRAVLRRPKPMLRDVEGHAANDAGLMATVTRPVCRQSCFALSPQIHRRPCITKRRQLQAKSREAEYVAIAEKRVFNAFPKHEKQYALGAAE